MGKYQSLTAGVLSEPDTLGGREIINSGPFQPSCPTYGGRGTDTHIRFTCRGTGSLNDGALIIGQQNMSPFPTAHVTKGLFYCCSF